MKKVICVITVCFGMLFVGCATTKLQTQAKMTRSISLSPEVLENKQVHLRVTGTKASILDIEKPLRKALKKRGVTLVDNSEDAIISLHVNTLFANNLKEATNYGIPIGGGIMAGALAKGNGNSSGDSILIGIGAALAMGIVEHAMADETYRAVIDISLRIKDKTNDWGNEDKTRVLVEAIKMGLDIKEAKPIMEEKAIYKIDLKF